MFKLQADNFSRGFQITFENGNTISVQFGKLNYCSNKGYDDKSYESGNAEIAIWDEDGNVYQFYDYHTDSYSPSKGWVSSDDVARWISYAQQTTSSEHGKSNANPLDGVFMGKFEKLSD